MWSWKWMRRITTGLRMRGNCGIKDSRSSVTNADSRELLNYSDLSKIIPAISFAAVERSSKLCVIRLISICRTTSCRRCRQRSRLFALSVPSGCFWGRSIYWTRLVLFILLVFIWKCLFRYAYGISEALIYVTVLMFPLYTTGLLSKIRISSSTRCCHRVLEIRHHPGCLCIWRVENVFSALKTSRWNGVTVCRSLKKVIRGSCLLQWVSGKE